MPQMPHLSRNKTPFSFGLTESPSISNAQTSVQGMVSNPNLDSGEFSFVRLFNESVTKVQANASRLFTSSNAPAVQQAEPLSTGPAWYDIPGRIANAASGVNDAFQSTLVKVIVLVSVVGVVAIFGLSFLQAKGAALAK